MNNLTSLVLVGMHLECEFINMKHKSQTLSSHSVICSVHDLERSSSKHAPSISFFMVEYIYVIPL
jgi:hypothetical protein